MNESNLIKEPYCSCCLHSWTFRYHSTCSTDWCNLAHSIWVFLAVARLAFVSWEYPCLRGLGLVKSVAMLGTVSEQVHQNQHPCSRDTHCQHQSPHCSQGHHLQRGSSYCCCIGECLLDSLVHLDSSFPLLMLDDCQFCFQNIINIYLYQWIIIINIPRSNEIKRKHWQVLQSITWHSTQYQ